MVQKECLNTEWVLEREINSLSIWPALPPQPQGAASTPTGRRWQAAPPIRGHPPAAEEREVAGSNPVPGLARPLPVSHLHALAKMMPKLLAGSPLGALLYPEWVFLSGCSFLPTCKRPDLVLHCSIDHILEQGLKALMPKHPCSSLPAQGQLVLYSAALSPVSRSEFFVCIASLLSKVFQEVCINAYYQLEKKSKAGGCPGWLHRLCSMQMAPSRGGRALKILTEPALG